MTWNDSKKTSFSATDKLHKPLQPLPARWTKTAKCQAKPHQELRLLWRRRNFQPGAGSRLPHAWKEKETQAQPMLLIVDYNKDPQKDMNDNLQSIYQYLWTKEIEREQRLFLLRFNVQNSLKWLLLERGLLVKFLNPCFKDLLKVLNHCSSSK